MAKQELWVKKLTMGRDHVLRFAVLLSAAIPIWFMVAALGTKFGIWDYKVGLGQMTFSWGPALVFMALVVALFGLYSVLIVRPWGGRLMLAVAFLIPILSIVGLGAVRAGAAKVPPIHDVSTDPASQLNFSKAVLDSRGDSSNPIVSPAETKIPNDPRFSAFAGLTIADAQAKAYPNVKPLKLPTAPAAAFAAAEKAVLSQGLKIGSKDAGSGTIEAVAESFWFGFKDDVIVRITPDGTGSRVDVRSISRVGLSDLGANAKRVEAILAATKG